jgi:hypothetical protein
MFQHHVTPRHVKGAVKVTRKAINHALDAAEPKLESAACELEDLTRDAYKKLRKASLQQLGDIKSGYGKLERHLGRTVRKQLPPLARRKNAGKMALIAVGIAALAIGLLRS